ncbi:MAG: ATP-binding protein [Candidatus Omnitrophota bacterium]
MVKKAQRSQSISVLIIESVVRDLRLLLKLLAECRSPRFRVKATPSLKKGLEALASGDYQVVLADVSLKDARGMEVFDEIHRAFPKVPVVLLSRLGDQKRALAAVRRGAQDYLIKAKLNSSMLSRVLCYAIERRIAQEDIFIAEEKYRMVFENSAVAIVLNDRRLRAMSWNRFFEAMINGTSREIARKPMASFFPKAVWPKVEAYYHDQNSNHEFEAQIFRAGQPIDVNISLSFIRDSEGNVTGAINMIQDISARKMVEKLKDEFTSTVSHEIRTPMTVIREGVSQVMDGILGPCTDLQKDILVITLENIDRLARILNDLLDFSKMEAGKMPLEKTATDLVLLARKAIALFTSVAKDKGITMAMMCDQEKISCYADPDRIMQVLSNLLDNALKFTSKGRIEIALEAGKDFVECRVADSGRGIARNEMPFVFDKFQQFSREIGPGLRGTGLGLAICKKIVEMHGGTIQVQSEVGRGSTFTFRLPSSTHG